MSLTTYELFCTIAEVGSITHAAELLHISPSAASHAISTLENSVGFPLLTRKRTGTNLTPYGALLLPRFQAVVLEHTRLQDEIAQINGLEKGSVHLGVLGGVCTTWLPEILGSFHEKHPGIDVKIYQDDYSNIERMLLDGFLDLGFLSLPASDKFKTIQLVQDLYVCIAPPNFKAKNPPFISLEELQNNPLLIATRTNDRSLKTLMTKYKLRPSPKHNVVLEEAAIIMVESGIGLSILPELAIKARPGNYQIFQLHDTAYRTLGLSMLKGKKSTIACKKMIQEIQRIVVPEYVFSVK